MKVSPSITQEDKDYGRAFGLFVKNLEEGVTQTKLLRFVENYATLRTMEDIPYP